MINAAPDGDLEGTANSGIPERIKTRKEIKT